MAHVKLLGIAVIALASIALYDSHPAAPAQEKLATLSVTPPIVAILVEKAQSVPAPTAQQRDSTAPTEVLLVTGDGQQAQY